VSKKKLKLSKPKRTRRGRGSECELDDAAAAKRRLLAWASIYGSKCKVKKNTPSENKLFFTMAEVIEEN
jgi:hypothetical protein